MASTVNVLRAIWLDPFSPLDESDKAQLRLAGIDAACVNTLGELNLALSRAHVVVVRLAQSAELMHEVQTLIAQLGSLVPVVCRVDRQDLDVVVDAMRSGALHVVPCDEWNVSSWQQVVGMLRSASPSSKNKSYVFVDPVSQHLLALAQRVAQANVSTLLVGPTGAGKEVIARVLHESSGRAKGPFVAMNCAAMPEHLIEDMLFGHEKGAFTGAVKDYKGIFEQAQGGTVFLDEIGEMPMHLQAKLLRVLQERKITRLGGESPVSVDIRVVAATNKDLRQAIDAREFREDLYFRISTFRLRIQPLRERPLDIMPLVMQSLARHGDSGLPYSVTAEAQQLLQAYPWPGNVRELENVVQRAVVLCTGQTITPAHLLFDEMSALTPAENTSAPAPTGVREVVSVVPPVIPMSAEVSPTQEQPPLVVAHDASTVEQPSTFSVAALPPQAIDLEPSTVNLQDVIKSSEHAVIMSAIQNTESREEAARLLGISPRTLRYKLAQLRERGLMLNAA
ncbi:MAG: sigma-54-dependent Fis family transcriptional regulator [Betaproteobacteria bacterium]|nr:sigma-54-dependent Fis family transcriptional regulator [Betaproteobacteria bacterium]